MHVIFSRLGLLLFFASTTALPSMAQAVFTDHFVYKLGDDENWAAPGHSTEGWADGTRGRFPFREWRKEGIGWLRYQFFLPRESVDRALHLEMIYCGALEFYVDGKLAFKVGEIGSTADQDQPKIAMIPVAHRIPIDSPGEDHLLAIRYATRFMNETKAYSMLRPRLIFRSKEAQAARESVQRSLNQRTFHQKLVTAALLLVTLSFGLLQLTRYKSRLGTAFAGLTTSLALFNYFSYQKFFTDAPSEYLMFFRLFLLAYAMVMIFGLAYIYAFGNTKPPKQWFVFSGLALGLCLLAVLDPRKNPLMHLLMLVVFLEMVRSLIVTRKRKAYPPGSGVLLFGLLPFLLVSVIQVLTLFGIMGPLWAPYVPAETYAFLLLVVAMVFFTLRTADGKDGNSPEAAAVKT